MNFDTSIRANLWKWLVLLAVAIFSIAVTTPLGEKIRLGLDLKGGTSFTLGVDEDALRESVMAQVADTNDTAAIQARVDEALVGCDDRVVEVVRRRVDGMGMNEPVIQGMKGHRLLVQLPGIDDATRAEAKRSLQSASYLEFRLTHPRNQELASKLMSSGKIPEGYVLSSTGEGFARATNYVAIAKKPGYKTRLSSFGRPPQGYQFMLEKSKDNSYHPNYVSRKTELTGEYLVSARVERDQVGRPVVGFKLNSKGGNLMRKLTRNYIAHGAKNATDRGRELAIILDGTLVSAPVLQSEIETQGQISGSFSVAEAQRLANDLNAGALPVPLKLLAEESVSPTVGEDAKQAGLIAALLGFALVALFMFIYYWYAGVIANIALLLDIVLLPAALVIVANVLGVFAKDASMGATGSLQLPVLTMPGIAGIVLTLGMAVDANVIIFERIREEFANKASVSTAIKNGYGRAFTAILDSNITTIVTGIILFIVGTGPVRGFAITLTGGVVISMFTAVVVTRLVMEKTSKPDSMKPFKMLNIFKKVPNIDFVKLGKSTTIISAVLVVLTISIFAFRAAMKPESVLAVDLTGGTSIVFDVKGKMPSVADVRKTLDPFDNATIIQTQGADKLLVKTGYTSDNAKQKGVTDVAAHVTGLMTKAFPDAGIELSSNAEVGSVVGADLKKSGTWAVILSLCAILIYVAFRFEFGFGLGALVALAHDALISLGLYSICGRQVSLLVITALLTIIGYSVNDTIVVFDRIREDLRKDQKTGFKELCNRALNECLSRTVITSVTTFFAVVALFAFGDGSIFDFALTMLIGVIAGTYSSVFIATPVMMWWFKGRRPQFTSQPAADRK
jgi:SecD/SecF fusion protein